MAKREVRNRRVRCVLSRRLELAITIRSMSCRQLGLSTGWSSDHVEQAVQGRHVISVAALAAFATALGFSTDWLLGLKPRRSEMPEKPARSDRYPLKAQ